MAEMTSYERFKRMFEHKEADRVPIIDDPWGATIERWHAEGMPTDISFVDYFGLDHVADLWLDNSPRYEAKVLEENDTYTIATTPWGVRYKVWKHAASTPEFLDFTIVDPDSWRKAKALMTPTSDRIPWDHLKANYKTWRERGSWLRAHFWFGFDITHSWIVGTERFLVALRTDPQWCMEIFNTCLDMNIALYDQIWDAGYTFDSIFWCDDMGYKNNQFFGLDTYRELLRPVHQRAVEWAHKRGIYAHLHSCGDVNPFIPDLIDIGVNALNPLEVKAGMNPIAIKKKFGDKLVLHGGINAVLWDHADQIIAEMDQVIPTLKENGGYIFSSDHSVPSTVSLENFRLITQRAKQLGSYT